MIISSATSRSSPSAGNSILKINTARQSSSSPPSPSSSSSLDAKGRSKTDRGEKVKKDGEKGDEEIRMENKVEISDDQVRERLEAISGQGGIAGLELEGGKPVAMKRGVKENMFRLI